MLHKTRGIVINQIRFKESSIIVRIYTEEFGLQSYIVNSVRSKNSKNNKIALFQPLTLLDLVVYYSPTKSLNRISEQRCSVPLTTIPYTIVKSSLALFISEVMGKILMHENEANQPFFDFLFKNIITLDLKTENLQNYHITFLINSLFFLGIQPQSTSAMFDTICLTYQTNNNVISPSIKEAVFIDSYLEKKIETSITPTERRNILQLIITFLGSQIDNFGTIKSYEILHEVLH